MEPFLSIIVPVFNIEIRIIKKCLESLTTQKQDGYKVIIVDDGSKNGCEKICDEYSKKYPYVTVIHQNNQGVSIARNKGLENVTTDWVCFVDPDDWVEPNYVSTLFELTQKSKADIYFFDYYQEYADSQRSDHLPFSNGLLHENEMELIRIAPFHPPLINNRMYTYEYSVLWNKMYKTELFVNHEISFVPEARKGQDMILNAEIYQCSKSMYCYHKCLYHYRYLQSSITNKYNPQIVKLCEISFREKERIIKKYKLNEKYIGAYYAHVLTRFYSFLRLYYFHPNCDLTYKESKTSINHMMNRKPYNNAIDRANIDVLSRSQKIFVRELKKRHYLVLKLLLFAKNFIKKQNKETLQ